MGSSHMTSEDTRFGWA